MHKSIFVLTLIIASVFSSVAYAETYGDPLHYAFPAKPIQPQSKNPAVSNGIVFKPERININSADAVLLDKHLKGVGVAKAKAIIAYREAHGPFASVDELLEVKGIGPAILEKNREILTTN
ncbi:competence protein ComEA [Pseudomonas duriflava]|uniref:Competence protein ComEA n=1 Tax=Pseudomonas duriflava TaxID=459528 RepID=A0A562QB01_9PSED|nr:ComEA family DNA-binding protein [Pseudomonas duriflava]TWI53927.1 competence protein ComEA [Pseudomonas duriflava]